MAFLWGPGSLKGKEALGRLPLKPETRVCVESLSVEVSGNKMKEMIGTQVRFSVINFHLHLLTKKKGNKNFMQVKYAHCKVIQINRKTQ